MLKSKHLELVPLTYEEIVILQKSRAELETLKGWTVSAQWIDADYKQEIEDAFGYWLPQTAANPEHYIWFTAWEIILTEKNLAIGAIGFMGLPNQFGETMVGYHIDKNYQKKGFATEALNCLLHWAFQNKDLKAVVADTLFENPASHKVLQKNGFLFAGESKEEDIHVWQWKLFRENFFQIQSNEIS
jgi:RimJ/RimL family protein N-acetyltransferase